MLDALVVLGWVQTSGLDSLRDVVKGLLGLEDTRTQQLTRIESKVDALLDRPYGKAVDWLGSAQRADLDTDKGKTYLNNSINDFREAAAGYEKVAPRRASWACLYLLLLYTALGDVREAQEWGARSYGAAVRWVQEEVRAFENRYKLRRGRFSLFSLAAIVLIFLVVLLVVRHGRITIGPSKSAFITITSVFVGVYFVILTMGGGFYRLAVSKLARRQMRECKLFLDQMYRIWAKLSTNSEEVKFYTILTVEDTRIEISFIFGSYQLPVVKYELSQSTLKRELKRLRIA
jgi:hypothetical protein